MPFEDYDLTYYTSDDISDPAFQFWRQVNLFMQSQPQIVQNFNNEFHYVFYFVHTYFTANGGMTINNKQYISDVLLLLSNWYYDQTYVGFDTDEKLHFALQAEKYALENNIPLADLVDLLEDWTDPTRVKPTTRFKNHAKLNSIYNKIKTAANFNQYLKNFIPSASVAHLMFDFGTVTKPDAIAQTKEPNNYWIKITFNINIMVNFLKQVYGSQYTDLEYRAVAWLGGGLKGTRAWNLLPQSEKTLLEKTYQDNYYLWEL